MESTRQIYWHEGLFLRAHHFQQQDLFHQSRLRDALSLALPVSWGVVEQAVSEPALASQVFEVVRGAWVFPDGSLARLPGNAHLPPRPFADLWGAAGEPLAVYVGLRRLLPGGRNAEQAGETRSTEWARFRISDEPVPTRDLYDPPREEGLLYLDYNLRLFFGDEVQRAGEYECLKIAEVQRYGSEVRLVEGYVPPTVVMSGAPLLKGTLRDVRERVTARARELALFKTDQRRGALDLGSRDFLYFVASTILNRCVPALHHLGEQVNLTPWEAYGLLRQVAGELSTVSLRRDALGRLMGEPEGKGLPPYDHADLGGCFRAAAALIVELLDELVAGPDYTVRLVFDGTYHFAELPARVFEGHNRYYLCVRTSLPREVVVPSIVSTSKLSSREYLPIVIARSLPGVGLEHLPSPPAELPRRPDAHYFAVDPAGAPWDAIRSGLNAAVYFDRAPGELELELMVTYGK